MTRDEVRVRLAECPRFGHERYKRDVAWLLECIADLEPKAACPCCKSGVNLQGEMCGDCHGSGLAILAYEHVRLLWKQQRDKIADLEQEIERLKQ